MSIHKNWPKSFQYLIFAFLFGFALFPFFNYAQETPINTSSASQLLHSTVEPFKTDLTQNMMTFRYQLRILGFLTIISLLPFAVMMLTSFTRISIIFHFLRQALGYQQVPSNQIVIGLTLILTGFIMQPVIKEIQNEAVYPYMNQELKQDPEVVSGAKSEETVFVEKAWEPLRRFLLKHTREKDLMLFIDISQNRYSSSAEATRTFEDNGAVDYGQMQKIDDVPWFCIVPAFVMSELRLAFMMGFLLFLPFLIIDMVVASILMSMGMMMLPPVLISTPFKLLLFILIDGWRLVIQQIVRGF